MAGKFLKGALVQLTEALHLPVPNVVVFQYNPETIEHHIEPASFGLFGGDKDLPAPGMRSNPLAVSGHPRETFSFRLLLDASDRVAAGDEVAITAGVTPALAALESFLFPVEPLAAGLGGSVSAGYASAGGSLGPSAALSATIPTSVVPTAFLVWGATRILPVRVSSLHVEEKIFNESLAPVQAEVSAELVVLTPEDLLAQVQQGDIVAFAGTAAYEYSRALRQGLSLLNLSSNLEAIGALPL